MEFMPTAAAPNIAVTGSASRHTPVAGKGIASSFSTSRGASGASSLSSDAWQRWLAAGLLSGLVSSRAVCRKSGVTSVRAYGRGRGDISPAEIRELTERKQARERSDFDGQQDMFERNGGPPAVRESAWVNEERRLFKAAHVSAGIDFSKYEDIEVETEGGQGTEEGMETFQDACDRFGLHEDLTANIARCGYNVPTPVQKHSIPAVLGGSDVLVTAQTGSGKTAAFLVPIVAAALKAGQRPFTRGPAHPTSVVLAPTRELCQQIAVEARRLCFRSSCRVVEIYGGADSRPQLAGLAKGCEIVVCTPGRLEDFLSRGFVSMESVQFLALDEADRMLDMGFEPSIRSIVENHGMPEPGVGEEGRQTMMFSATFPQEMQDMALDYLHHAYYMIRVGRVGATTSMVEQRFVDATNTWDKQSMLPDILKGVVDEKGEIASTIVFANQKRIVDDIFRYLNQQSIRAVPVHGDHEQRDRNQAIADMKTGRASVLVATDVASRGLDLPGVGHVVNFDLPANEEDYVHRIGRTGRIGNKGVATSLVGNKETALRGIVKNLQQDKDAPKLPKWLTDLARS
eukprot:TRINITY_DN1137_c0_g1_i2.p1 TRINITY_DN1137_c0_g1~~TRINITY_DN1137_c0_g1_i2.p1  ORF type:complete len:571 (-),score=125.18 TRINITY_DN1137_c0_g1_i2:148-1860(-)